MPTDPEAREPVERISAVTLLVTDMARSLAFYRALGFRVLYGGESEAFTSLRAGTGYLNLQAAPDNAPPRTSWGRVIFWVDDVDDMHARAVGAGFSPAAAPQDAPWGERYFHLVDPDGHELSFARPLNR